MSEKFESSIERNNIRVTRQLGSEAVLFDLMNTHLFEHSEEYKHFDHIYRRNDNATTGSYLFRDDFSELYDELDNLNFTKTRSAYPSESDEMIWVGLQDRRLQYDLEKFERTGDSEY